MIPTLEQVAAAVVIGFLLILLGVWQFGLPRPRFAESRYFLFYFRWDCEGCDGAMNVAIEHDVFPSREYLCRVAASRTPTPIAPDDVCITNWDEFKGRDDYMAFIGDEPVVRVAGWRDEA